MRLFLSSKGIFPWLFYTRFTKARVSILIPLPVLLHQISYCLGEMSLCSLKALTDWTRPTTYGGPST